MVDVKIQCQDCNRITEVDEDMFTSLLICQECGGYFDEYEEDSDDDECKDEDSYEEEISEEPILSKDESGLDDEVQSTNFNPEAKTKFD